MGSDECLGTPWLRAQLIEALGLLANERWLFASLNDEAAGSEALDGVLDLLDDTGAVDDPDHHVGAFFFAAEVGAARSLGCTLDMALGSTDVALWTQVSRDALHLLDRMLDPPGQTQP